MPASISSSHSARSRGGRPRKYQNEDEKQEAKRKMERERQKRKRQQSRDVSENEASLNPLITNTSLDETVQPSSSALTSVTKRQLRAIPSSYKFHLPPMNILTPHPSASYEQHNHYLNHVNNIDINSNDDTPMDYLDRGLSNDSDNNDDSQIEPVPSNRVLELVQFNPRLEPVHFNSQTELEPFNSLSDSEDSNSLSESEHSNSLPELASDLQNPVTSSTTTGFSGLSDLPLPQSEIHDLVEFLVDQLLATHSCPLGTHSSILEGAESDIIYSMQQARENGQELDIKWIPLRQFTKRITDILSGSRDILSSSNEVNSGPLYRFLNTEPPFQKLSVRDCKEIFEGLSTAEDRPITQLILDTIKTSYEDIRITPMIFFDIDSFIAIPRSLAIAKNGLQLCFYSPRVMNLQSDIHLRCNVPSTRPGQTKAVSYHKVPHTYLGRLTGFEDCRLYIFFPSLFEEQRETSYLLDTQYERLINAFLDAMRATEYLDCTTTQHYPSSFLDAKLKGMARSKEQGVKNSPSESRVQMLHYYVPSEALHDIWTRLRQKFRTPGYQDLQNPILLLNAKNLKLLFRSEQAISVVQKFLNTWQYSINAQHVNEQDVWLDLGKEIVPGEANNTRVSKYSCLWRRCCLHEINTRFYLGLDKSSHSVSYYPIALTDDYSNMTITPHSRHALRQIGLMYSQFYSSTKELFDAGKAYPFHEDSLEGLCIDENLRKIWTKEKAGAKTCWSREKVMKSYLAAKQRVAVSLQSASQCNRSFGVREEHRMRWDLFQSVGRVLSNRTIDEWPPSITDWPFQVFQTSDILELFHSNVLKFAFGFEYSLMKDAGGLISLESSKMATMFLRLLKSSLGGARLETDSGLWSDVGKLDLNGRQKIGIGLKKTMRESRYGFIKAGKIDWEYWSFSKTPNTTISFQYNTYYLKVNRQYNQVDRYSRTQQTALELLQWVSGILSSNASYWTLIKQFDAVSAVWIWFCSIFVWEFQLQVLEQLQVDSNLCPEFSERSSWKPDNIRFSEEGLSELIRSHIVWGSATGKTAVERLQHLWLFDDDQSRQNWSSKQYRTLYQTLTSNWNQFLSIPGWTWDDDEFLKFFVRVCWVWPNTTNSKWWTKSSDDSCRIWQGLHVTSLWFDSSDIWILRGPEGVGKIGYPDKLKSEWLILDSEDIIQRVIATAGTLECPGHLAAYQFRWQWGNSSWRRALPPTQVILTDGTTVFENTILRSPSEQHSYDSLISQPEFLSQVLFQATRLWYKQMGYSHVHETVAERIQRQQQYLTIYPMGRRLNRAIKQWNKKGEKK